MKKRIILYTTLVVSLMSCAYQAEEADLIVHNAVIYSLDPSNTVYSAMAIKDGKIIETGAERHILNKYKSKDTYDAGKQVVYPGFIDPHSHFIGYALSLGTVNLFGTSSWEEVLKLTAAFADQTELEWILGRGWDQNDWEIQDFPDRAALDSLFPDKPVMLMRIDGHAAIVNQKAIDISGLTPDTKVAGGIIEVKGGELTGILIDNAMSLVKKHIADPAIETKKKLILKAQENCLSKGLSSVCDAGLSVEEIELIREMQDSGELKMKVYAMISEGAENFEYFDTIPPLRSDKLTVTAFKFYADGALGSRGACLLEPYSDVEEEFYGLMTIDRDYFIDRLKWCDERGYQVCTHAIGDSAVRMVLNAYGEVLGDMNDKRWRIEHSQIVHPDDLPLFRKFTVIPSVQPTHATSDMYWAIDRLGPDRIARAYNWKQLKDQLEFIPLGTDFPIEDIDPLKTFFSACIRKDDKLWPEAGFQKEAALSREESLYGMTLWAALANFEETNRGSLEPGKAADFTILNRDLLKVPEEEILKAKCLATFIDGEQLFKAE